MASRYAPSSSADSTKQNATQVTSPSSVTTDSNTTSTKTGTSTTNTKNMTDSSQMALESLISQLLSGGTAAQKKDRAVKDGEIGTLQNQRQGYSKDAAFADAQGLMAQQMRLALEKLLPNINNAALGAGASQSSMRALLTQRAAENAAENASAAGLGAAVNYGQVSNGISGVLANLLAQQDPVAGLLINALNVSKGATTSSTTSGTETTNSTGSQVQNNSGNTNSTFYTPPSVTPLTAPAPNFVSYGPQQTDLSRAIDNLKYTGTTTDTLQQLQGLGDQRWAGYKF